jgi:Astacin (Peptidase family M12A)/LGFP repeat
MLMNAKKSWRALAVVTLLAGCVDELDQAAPTDETTATARRGWIVTDDGPLEISYVVRADGSKLAEGDMVLDEVFDTKPVTAARGSIIHGKQWPNAVVPYEIDPNLPDQSRVTWAVNEWNNNTPYRWVPRTNETAFVRFIRTTGNCESKVGRQGDRQDIPLNDNCGRGNAAHEMGHAVGFKHEHSRKDRDNYININWDNIKPGKKSQFDKVGSDYDDWGVYDVTSLMHYESYIYDTDFVYDTSIPTITRKDGTIFSRASGFSSGLDRAMVWFRADVASPIKTKWNQKRGVLGWPLDRELPAGNGGTYLRTQNGRILYRADVGAYEVHGSILERYNGIGSEFSFLGFPTTDENTTPDGVGRFNHFQGGSIYWHPNLGAFLIYGAIRDKWASLGWERSSLGYPITDETGTPDGIGRYNHFQFGSIYHNPSYGTFAIPTHIRDQWAATGWERGCLGYPISDEIVDSTFPPRSHQLFAHGRISFRFDSGTTFVCN